MTNPVTLAKSEEARPARSDGRWIADWEPEDPVYWDRTGRHIAQRNLIVSVLTEHIGFSVWLLWSIVAVNLTKAGFDFSTAQLFWLVAVPNLVGAFLRLPYTFAVTLFGGRNWTIASSIFLLVPTLLLACAVADTHTPYWIFLLVAATAGLGGGNFASSMANISFFYPQRYKGTALGINAAGGNLGVSVVQFLVPLVIAAGGGVHLSRVGALWAALSLIGTLCAWLFMDNLHIARADIKEQLKVIDCKHTWVMSLLYIGTFGSFIGYSSAMPLLVKMQFPDVPAAQYACIGPLVGSLARPVGGWLADRIGGAKITFWTFVLMSLGVVAVLASLQAHHFTFFLACFFALFVLTGFGNGSTYRMIPSIFCQRALSENDCGQLDSNNALRRGRREAATVIGIASSIGAAGGFLIPLSYANFGIIAAFLGFLVFYAICLAITWWYYIRKFESGNGSGYVTGRIAL